MDTFKFKTKAETLELLYNNLTTGMVKKPFYFSVGAWQKNSANILKDINEQFKEEIVVRSSSQDEDTSNSSNAGKFTSLLNISSKNSEQVESAINEVILSYGKESSKENFVLVQEQLKDIIICGVAFTRDINTLAPYYIINYDDSGSSDSVTSGTGKDLKTWIRYRDRSNKHEDPNLTALIQTIQEIEELFNSSKIDIEFAVDSDLNIWILQARPIVNTVSEFSDEMVRKFLNKVHKKVDKLNRPHVNIFGKRTVFGVMPDWNPAEIIGIKPNKLALSLYKELVTDRVWAYQRDNYGYRNLRSYPLLVSFLGCPYIDTRVSFNSFIPKSLSNNIARKVVDYYLEQLVEHPESHDKVEFDIIISCYHFNVNKKLRELKEKLKLTDTQIIEFKESLKELTNSVMASDGLCKKDIGKIDELKKKYREVMRSEMTTIEKIFWLCEDCKRYGTLPFAGIARAAFIAVQMMKSLVLEGVITEDEYDKFMGTLFTVSKDLSNDLKSLSSKDDESSFLAKFGHLRPGTYDILSRRYDESFSEYFTINKTSEIVNEDKKDHFSFNKTKLNKIDDMLRNNGLTLTAVEFLSFVKTAIEGREYAKLIFTRNISKILSLIEKLGSSCGMSANDMSHIDILTLLNLYATLDAHDLKDILTNNIEVNKKAYKITNLIKLPPLIRDSEDIYGFFLDDGQPNFITTKRISGEVINEKDFLKKDIKGRIVFIPSADPGYDWIFSKNIAGLVTMFGGANSHMAIRAAELGLPAIIGCGEKKFNGWKNFKHIEIDCCNKLVRELII